MSEQQVLRICVM